MDFHQMTKMETATRIGFACAEAAGPTLPAKGAWDRALFVAACLVTVLAVSAAAIMGA